MNSLTSTFDALGNETIEIDKKIQRSPSQNSFGLNRGDAMIE